jgi:hypothetical protein
MRCFSCRLPSYFACESGLRPNAVQISWNWNGSTLELQELPGVFAPIQNQVAPMSSLPLMNGFGIYSYSRSKDPALGSYGRKSVDSFRKIIEHWRRGTKVMSVECRPFRPHHFFHPETPASRSGLRNAGSSASKQNRVNLFKLIWTSMGSQVVSKPERASASGSELGPQSQFGAAFYFRTRMPTAISTPIPKPSAL